MENKNKLSRTMILIDLATVKNVSKSGRVRFVVRFVV